MAFLSFNPDISNALSYAAADQDKYKEVLKKELPLKNTWVLWEQIMQVSDGGKAPQHYSDATHKVAGFNTVQSFWRIWNSMPQPSSLLDNSTTATGTAAAAGTAATTAAGQAAQTPAQNQNAGGPGTSKRMVREIVNPENGMSSLHVIDAIMIFKQGIRPEWEDKENSSGGHFQFQLRSTMEGGQIDEYWNNLVLGVVGGTIEPSNIITGVRLVDKLSGPRQANGIRLEVWFSNYDDTNAVALLKKNVERCMSTRLDGVVGQIPKCDAKTHQTGKH